MGSGGGNTQTTSGGIDPEFRPYIKDVLADVTSKYKSETAAGAPELVGAYNDLGDTAKRLGEEAAMERGGLDKFKEEGAGALAARGQATQQMGQDWNQMISNDLGNVAGQQTAGLSQMGALGSARGERAKQAALSDRAVQLRQAENQAKSQAGQTLANLDTSEQSRYLAGLGAKSDLAKSEYMSGQQGVEAAAGALDAPHRAAQRYFGYLGSGAVPTTQTTTSSGK